LFIFADLIGIFFKAIFSPARKNHGCPTKKFEASTCKTPHLSVRAVYPERCTGLLMEETKPVNRELYQPRHSGVVPGPESRKYQLLYILTGGNVMQTAKIFQNGRSQAVRLPKEFQFTGEDVYIQKHGKAVLLVPHEKSWEVFLEGLDGFSDDFMKEGRDQGKNQEKEGL